MVAEPSNVRRCAMTPALGLLLAAMVAVCGCSDIDLFGWGSSGDGDSFSKSGNLGPFDSKWDQLHVLGAVPLKKIVGADGKAAYAPLCRGIHEEPDALQLNVIFRGFPGASGTNDHSFKPGDTIYGRVIDPAEITPDLFQLWADCMEPCPDGDLFACGTNASLGELSVDDVSFFGYHWPKATNTKKVAVVVLFDMSGSMNGLAMQFAPYWEEPLHGATASFLVDPQATATDPKNARYTALESFMKSLNKDDALLVIPFNETSIDIACEIAGAPEPDWPLKLEHCFGTDRSYLLVDQDGTAKNALDELKGNERGRTPLWTAVRTAYEILETHPVAAKYDLRHILVIGDGPDTCAESTDLSQCTGECTAYHTSFNEVREQVEAEPVEERIPVHFVQMAAKGYPDRDPRQQEIACLTGGQYAFVNTLDIPDSKLPDVLGQVVKRIRYSFRGYWRLRSPMGPLPSAKELDSGWLYAISGSGKVLPGPGGLLVNHSDGFAFKVDDPDVGGYDGRDGRLALRVPCDPSAPDACPGSTVYNECSSLVYWCDEQTLTCRSATEWLPDGELSTCQPQEVYVSLETRTKSGSTTLVGNELYKIANVEKRCCHGGCMPPAPPPVPEEVALPRGMISACFWYDDNKGWTLQNPAKFDHTIVDCVDSGDCGDDSKCLSNVCARTCIFESDCEAGDLCWQSSCVPTCHEKADCPGGWDCMDGGFCRPMGCEADEDCDEGYGCVDEQCEYDFEAPDAYRWIYFATLNVKEGCMVEDFEPYLSAWPDEPFDEDDWAYCAAAVNCIQPPD